MKKLAIVALALVLAMTFVGCGAANLLTGTSWDVKYGPNSFGRFEFKADNVCVYQWAAVEDSIKDGSALKLTYSWSADGNILKILDTKGALFGEYEVTIKGDEMTWVNTAKEEDVITLTRVKDAE